MQCRDVDKTSVPGRDPNDGSNGKMKPLQSERVWLCNQTLSVELCECGMGPVIQEQGLVGSEVIEGLVAFFCQVCVTSQIDKRSGLRLGVISFSASSHLVSSPSFFGWGVFFLLKVAFKNTLNTFTQVLVTGLGRNV